MGGGGGGFDVFEVPYITAKITFTHCIQFHNCIPYTDKKSFTFNTQSHVATFFSQTRVYFTLLCRGHFSRITTSIITAIQSVKPFSLMKMRSEIINIYFDTDYHTTAHYTVQLLFSICNHNIRFLLSELKRYVAL